MKVSIRRCSASQPQVFDNVENTYQKGDMFCIYIKTLNKVVKIPMADIFDVQEDYKVTKA